MRLRHLSCPGIFLVAACSAESPVEPFELTPEGPVQLINFDAAGRPLLPFDVDGNQVDVHGGEIHLFEGRYFWYGETYGCGFQWQRHEPSPFCGFRVYSSPDLTAWRDEGLLFDVGAWEPWQRRCNWWTFGCFRPHLEFNERTGRYVLWVNAYDDPVNYYVLEAESPTGPFVEVGVPVLAYNNAAPRGRVNNGDHNLFVDRDGTGYIIYTEWAIGGGDLVVERLTPDFRDGTGEHVRLRVAKHESPALFRRGDEYYITASVPPNAAYGTSATGYYRAASPLGPWRAGGILSERSCGGQPFEVSVLPTAAGEPWFLYQVDLWLDSDGVGFGDRNQAPAAQFHAPLAFNRGGEIQPIECRSRYRIDAWHASPPDPDPAAFALTCDVANFAGGATRREISTRATSGGRLRSVRLPVYQRDEPDGPLRVEVLVGDSLVRAEAVEPNGAVWSDPVTISWAARMLTVPVETQVAAGDVVAVRLSTAAGAGCYGVAIGDAKADDPRTVRISTDGGVTWRVDPGQITPIELEIGE